jgi:hypothetical protein
MNLRSGKTTYTNNSELKACGHTCCIGKLTKCCDCMDTRPIQSNYSCYVDGMGYMSNATRRQFYCLVCRIKK